MIGGRLHMQDFPSDSIIQGYGYLRDFNWNIPGSEPEPEEATEEEVVPVQSPRLNPNAEPFRPVGLNPNAEPFRPRGL